MNISTKLIKYVLHGFIIIKFGKLDKVMITTQQSEGFTYHKEYEMRYGGSGKYSMVWVAAVKACY